MALDSLRTIYHSWPDLAPEDKIELLARTEREIEISSTEKVSEFCLQVLSRISFENECRQNPSLNEPVRRIGLSLHSKSTDIFFQNFRESEVGDEEFIANKKKRQFIKKLESCKSELELIEIFNERQDYQSIPNLTETILKRIQEQYSKGDKNYLSKKALEMLNWYLYKTTGEVFSPAFSFKTDKPLCFAHYRLLMDVYQEDPINLVLGIKLTCLNCLIYGKQDTYFSVIRDTLFIYSEEDIHEMLTVIEDVLSLNIDSGNLRNDLVKIIQAVPIIQREMYTENLLSKKNFISSKDPLFLLMLEEMERTGKGHDLVSSLLVHRGMAFTIEFLKKLARIHPETCLVFAKSVISWSIQYSLGKDEDLLLFQYALSIDPDLDFVIDVTEYMSSVILTVNVDINALCPAIAVFFEKIKHLQEAYYFLYPIHEYAVRNNEFFLVEQLTEWSKDIWMGCSSNLSPLNCLGSLVTPLAIAELIIKQKSIISETGFADRLFKLLSVSECLKAYREKDLKEFQDEIWSDITKEKKKQVEFLTTVYSLVPSDKQILSLLDRCFLSLVMHLWYDGNYVEAIRLIEVLEGEGRHDVLFPLVEKVSSLTKDENYQILLGIAYETRSREFLIDFLKNSHPFTEFHLDLMNRIKADSFLSKKTF